MDLCAWLRSPTYDHDMATSIRAIRTHHGRMVSTVESVHIGCSLPLAVVLVRSKTAAVDSGRGRLAFTQSSIHSYHGDGRSRSLDPNTHRLYREAAAKATRRTHFRLTYVQEYTHSTVSIQGTAFQNNVRWWKMVAAMGQFCRHDSYCSLGYVSVFHGEPQQRAIPRTLSITIEDAWLSSFGRADGCFNWPSVGARLHGGFTLIVNQPF